MEENLVKIEPTKIKALNPNKQPLTVDILKTLLGNETMSDEEAGEIVLAIKKLVGIIVDYQYEEEVKENKEKDNLKQAA